VNPPSRLHPALDISWESSTPDVATLHEQLALALADFEVAAVQESDSSWRVFFPSAAARDEAALALGACLQQSGLALAPAEVADEDWARRSQANLQPVSVGRFIVAPPWAAPAGGWPPGAIVIRIQPSTGFGTGHHATTRLCLRALQAADVAGRSFLDIGTGSGVLAIAAASLGAAPIVAIDSDPDAIDSARENLELNGLRDRVRLLTGDFRTAAGRRARTVAANLTGAALIRFRSELAAAVEPGGTLVVSGFTIDEGDQVRSALSHIGEIIDRAEEDEWCTATVRVFTHAEKCHD
jgi:ribosomal protein L11 methyltransferase